MDSRSTVPVGFIVAILGLVFVFFAFIFLHSFFGYSLEGVSSTEVAIQMHAGQPIAVVGPGNYTDLQPFASLQEINVGNLDFSVSDPEVLTHDLQRVSVSASGTVSRPGKTNPTTLLDNWSQYSVIYTSDSALVGVAGVDCVTSTDKSGTTSTTCKTPPKDGVMQDIGRQAIKVCIGDLDFSKAVVGSARDDVRDCVTKELNNLASLRGLTIANVVVPVVGLGKAVQDSLDAITKARFDQQVADQQALTAKAQGDQQLAVASAGIRVEAGKVQEQAKQDALTADLNQKQLVAQRAVIEQQKSNDLFAAQQDLIIQQAQAQVALQKAQINNADAAVLARIYQDNPAYANQQAIASQSSAFKNTDKVIIPAGTNPNIIIGNGTQPVVQTPSR